MLIIYNNLSQNNKAHNAINNNHVDITLAIIPTLVLEF